MDAPTINMSGDVKLVVFFVLQFVKTRTDKKHSQFRKLNFVQLKDTNSMVNGLIYS